MNRYSLTRPALVSGILYSVLQAAVLVYFAVLVFPGLGPVEAPVEQRARAYAELADVLRLGNYLIMLPAPFFLVFLGGAAGAPGSATGADRVLSTVTVAAGAIMAMLWPLAAVIGVIIVLEMSTLLMGGFRLTDNTKQAASLAAQVSNSKALGLALYTQYLYPIQIAAVILLVAMIAAIALTLRARKDSRYISPSDQVHVRAADRLTLVKLEAVKQTPVAPPVPVVTENKP